MISMTRRDRNTLAKWIIGLTVVGVVLFIIIVSVALSLVLNQQFYENRLNLSWWAYFTMDNAAILLVPMITVVVMAVVVTLLNPVTSSTLTLIFGIFRRRMRPKRVYCLLWNYAVVAGVGGLVMGWVLGFWFDAGFGIFVANNVNLSYKFLPTLFAALSYPLNPGVMDPDVLFAYTYILRPFIVLVIVGVITKLILDQVNSIAFRERRGTNGLKLAGTVALVISLSFLIGWLWLPSAAFDVISSTFAISVMVGFFASLVIGLLFYTAGIINPQRYRGDRYYKSFVALAVISLLILPVIFVAIGGIKSLQYEKKWNEWVWGTKLSTQIAETRNAAGIFNYTTLTTQQLIDNQTGSGISDEQIIPHIRMFDHEASRISMEIKIGSSWESLADSDIVYVNGSEYWVAPRRISSSSDFSMNWVQEHIKYTHSRGFLAFNPVTGKIVSSSLYESIFGVPENDSIYFGEQPDNGYTLLHVPEYEEIENTTYAGEPDVTLDGLLNWWHIDNWGYKTGAPTDYLIKRNIYDRVGGILLPYMYIGDDPYLVFDANNSKMYYCVDIILAFPSFSGYIQSDIVRWLGVVLVDTKLGTMNFYEYGNHSTNLPYDFLQIYAQRYDWKTMPDWLVEQIKYPEELIEYQLSVDYIYHVTDRDTWKNEDDFFDLPENTDLHYIIYNTGQDLAYVGTSIVEFRGAKVPNLVGFYIIENGNLYRENLGRTTFYRNGTAGQTTMIGLDPAISAYSQADADFLKWKLNYRFGNKLIYPLAGSLYYVIPVYEITGEAKQTLVRVALVNAFDPDDIGIGNSTIEAYNDLNVTIEIPPGVLSITVLEAPPSVFEGIYDDLEIRVNNGYPDQSFNVSIEISTGYALFNVSFGGQEIAPVSGGGFYNYSIANLTLLETQYTGLFPKISGLVDGGQPYSPVNYAVNLYNETGALIDSEQRTVIIYPT